MKKLLLLSILLFSSCAHLQTGDVVRAYGKYIRNCTGTISQLDPGKLCDTVAHYAIVTESCELYFNKTGWENIGPGISICVEEAYPIHRIEYRK